MSKQRIKREKDFENGTVTFTVIETGESLTTSLSDYPDEMQRNFAVHGMNAALGDMGADPKVDAMAAIKSRHENVVSGVWTSRGDGTGTVRSTILFDAACRLYPDQDQDAVRTKIDSLSKEEKTDLGKHPKMAAFMDEIKKERQNAKAKKSKAAAADVTTDALTF